MLQQLDLAQRALGEDLFAEHIGDLFDRDAIAGMDVCCSTSSSPQRRLAIIKVISSMAIAFDIHT